MTVRKIKRICPVCGKTFTHVLEGGGGGNVTFCSEECRQKSRAEYAKDYRLNKGTGKVKNLDIWIEKRWNSTYVPAIKTSSGVRFGYEKKKRQ